MKRFEQFPYFLFLLPVFYYLYELTEYGNYLFSYQTVLLSFCSFSIISFLIYNAIIQLRKRNSVAFSIGFFVLMFVYLFFGMIKTGLMSVTPILGSYKILIPLIIVLMALLLRFLKKKGQTAQSVFQYCNILMLVLTCMQIGLLSMSFKNKPDFHIHELEFTDKKLNSTPNIYFILLDGYAGNESLKQYFHFDNHEMIERLQQKGFYVADSFHSNYNITAGSMNSLLNMQYINLPVYAPYNQYSFYLKSMSATKQSNLLNAFRMLGYRVNNLSIFDFDHIGKGQELSAWQKADELIDAPMFHHKLKHDLGWMLYTGRFKTDYFYNKEVLKQFHLNQSLIEKTITLSTQKSTSPHFTYTHLLLPHEPYFADSAGHLYNDEEASKIGNDEKYLSYLKYANTQIIKMADSIRLYDSSSLIVFLSDHGYRDYPIEKREFIYNNFFAIRLPQTDTIKLKSIKSSINIFPFILNEVFSQNLPYEQDRQYFIDEINNNVTLLQSKR